MHDQRIDISNETLVAMHEVPQLLPRRRSGKRLHISAVYRWAKRGVRGVRLETIKLGGTTYTSMEALERFAEQRSPGGQRPAGTSPRTSAPGRRAAADRASQRVNEVLGQGSERRN